MLWFFSDRLNMTRPENIAIVIEFLTLVCSEGRMRDWLGTEGRDFWLPLLSLLSNRPIESPSASASRYLHLYTEYLLFKKSKSYKKFFLLEEIRNCILIL